MFYALFLAASITVSRACGETAESISLVVAAWQTLASAHSTRSTSATCIEKFTRFSGHIPPYLQTPVMQRQQPSSSGSLQPRTCFSSRSPPITAAIRAACRGGRLGLYAALSM